jgi:pimeloyl-ACP methyl ester carboxylesterase
MLWLVIIATLIGLLGLGAAFQAISTFRFSYQFPPPGKIIDVDGCRLHYQVMGEGNPTVVVVSGQGATSLDWQLVQTKVAKFTKILTYDRAGYGWSDLSTEPRTSVQIVNELRQLLTQAGIKAPYILVGMSFGGLPVRLFAYEYPEEVAGMVLVDVTHEMLYERFPKAMVKLNEQFDWWAINILPVAARLGLLRLLILFDYLPLAPGLFKKFPVSSRPQAKAVYAHTKFWDAFGQESAEFNTTIMQVQQARAAKPFPAIPLVVISAGKQDFGVSQELMQIQKELLIDLANQSPYGVHIISEKSGHLIQLDDPELVINSIRKVVDEARSKGAV